MKKKPLSLIIGLMSLSLLALIGLQAYWVKHALAVKEEQFDRSVNDALTQVVHQLEMRELAAGFQKNLAKLPEVPQEALQQSEPIRKVKQSKSLQKQIPVKTVAITQTEKPAAVKTPEPVKKEQPKNLRKPEKQVIFWRGLPDEEIRVYRQYNQEVKENLRQLQHGKNVMVESKHPDSLRKYLLFRQSLSYSLFDTLPTVIRLNQDSVFKMLNADRLTEIKGFQYFNIPDSMISSRLLPARNNITLKADTLFLKKNSSKKSEIVKPAKTETIRPVVVTEEVIKRKEAQVNQVMEKMVMELVTKEVPLRKRLNFKEVDSLVATALADKHIDLPYAVAIASSRTDSLLHVNQVNTAFARNQPKYQVSLFPNDLVKKPEYLFLQFPDKQEYVLGSMWTMLSASAVFTLVMILTFGATLGFIFKQKKISDIKSDFINNMTHEFKTPIATISLATDAINSPKVLADSSRINYYTTIIQQENKRMLSQVENVLQMALLDRQDLKLDFEPLVLDDLLEQTMNQLKLQVESRQGQLTFDSGTAGIKVMADKLHLENVFLNLLDNANKYSPGVPVISVRTSLRNDKVVVLISDQGIGMPADVQKRVFDKFYRVPTGNLHNVKGFGLGLAYVKAMVEQHKGFVSVKSSAGSGSTFQVCLPVYKA